MKSLTQFILESKNLELNGFCILKPEFLDHEEDFLALLKNNDWNIVQKKKLLLTKEQSENLYSPHKDKDFYKAINDIDKQIKKLKNQKDKIVKQFRRQLDKE